MYRSQTNNLEDLRFLSREIHLVTKINISDFIYGTGLAIHDKRKSKFMKEKWQGCILLAIPKSIYIYIYICIYIYIYLGPLLKKRCPKLDYKSAASC